MLGKMKMQRLWIDTRVNGDLQVCPLSGGKRINCNSREIVSYFYFLKLFFLYKNYPSFGFVYFCAVSRMVVIFFVLQNA